MHRVQGGGGARRRWLFVVGKVKVLALITSCSSRLDKDDDQAERQVPSMQLKEWSQLHSGPYGIPERALRSYAYAAAAMDKALPACGIGWSTLAAIGDVSSSNATADGAVVESDGVARPYLRGLDQANPAGAKPIPDTDAGRFDGSEVVDRTMGPMQMMPSRWEQFATDADDDGKADPDNMDDATLSAARLLCAAGGDLRQPDGWARAVGQFNSTPGFVERVHERAAVFGR
uniref:lytic murein transglycosylase n=1 Tax=Gordonia sp. B7-2 TaxID=3420932 RepID=UPI003D8A081C